MCGIYCVYKQSRSCQLPFCASPIFHFEIGDFSVYYIYITVVLHVYYRAGIGLLMYIIETCPFN